MRRLTLVILLVALGIASPLPAVAAEGDVAGDGRVRAPTVAFEGAFDATLRDVALLGEDGAGFEVHAEQARIRIVWSELAVVNGVVLQSTSTVADRAFADAHLVLRADAGDGVVAGEAARADARVSRLALGLQPEDVSHKFYYVGEGRANHDVTLPAAAFATTPPAGLRAAALTLYLFNATIGGDHAAWVGWSVEEGASMGGTRAHVVNESYARVELVNATLTPLAHAPRAPALTADAVRVTGEGRATFRAASGWVAEGEGAAFADEDVVVEGALDATGRRATSAERATPLAVLAGKDAPPRWTISGSFDTVHVGDRVLVEKAGALVLGLLGLLGVYVLYSRIRDDAILNHPARRAIWAAVRREPGRPLEEVQRETGLASGTFRHHLHMLRARRLVTVHREGRFTLLLPPAASPDPMRLLPRKGKARDVVRYLVECGGASVPELTRALGTSHQLMYHHLATLTDLGLVRKEGARPARYAPLPDAVRAMDRDAVDER